MMRALFRGVLLASLLVGSAYAATPAGEELTPAQQMDEQQLRVQLERARALNAQLAAERAELQKTLDALEAQVSAKKQLVAQVSAAAPLVRAPVPADPAPWWTSPLADMGFIAGAVLIVIVMVVYWRRRTARKAA